MSRSGSGLYYSSDYCAGVTEGLVREFDACRERIADEKQGHYAWWLARMLNLVELTLLLERHKPGISVFLNDKTNEFFPHGVRHFSMSGMGTGRRNGITGTSLKVPIVGSIARSSQPCLPGWKASADTGGQQRTRAKLTHLRR